MTLNSDPGAIEQAIIEHWGERCPDFSDECPCCAVWAEYDALRAPLAALPTGDLVERLNAGLVLIGESESDEGTIELFDTDAAETTMSEAAAHIQALTAERDGLQRERTNIIATKHEQLATMREAVMDGQYLLGATGLELEAAQASATTAEARVKVLEAHVEQAFRDGLAYGSNVQNADPDTAWGHSRIRTALNPKDPS